MTIADSISQYEHLRAFLLGSEAGLRIELPGSNPGSHGFDAFVSSSHVALRETLAEDASFLAGVGVLRNHEVKRTVYLLRTARQHDDNQEAVTFYNTWLGNEPIDWSDAVERLVKQVEDYLRLLVRAAQAVRQSDALHQQWVKAASVSVASVFASVSQDLGLNFSPGARQAKVRAIEARYRRERPSGPKQRIIADFCVQEALSESKILPVDYSELLDALGLIRSRDASTLLSLAYATAHALPGLNGEDFIRKTSEMWWSLVQT